jgi:hypothetical protein
MRCLKGRLPVAMEVHSMGDSGGWSVGDLRHGAVLHRARRMNGGDLRHQLQLRPSARHPLAQPSRDSRYKERQPQAGCDPVRSTAPCGATRYLLT